MYQPAPTSLFHLAVFELPAAQDRKPRFVQSCSFIFTFDFNLKFMAHYSSHIITAENRQQAEKYKLI